MKIARMVISVIVCVYGFVYALQAYGSENDSLKRKVDALIEEVVTAKQSSVSKQPNTQNPEDANSFLLLYDKAQKVEKENRELKKEVSRMQGVIAQLERKASELYVEAKGAAQTRQDYEHLSRICADMNKERIVLKKGKEELEQKLKVFEQTSRQDQAQLYRALGTSYTQAQLFEAALEAYLKSLSLDPNNAEVHYDVGLLYKHSRDNTEKALYHLRQSLRLDPKLKNKKDIEFLINVLSNKTKPY